MLAFAILGLFGISFVVDLVTTELEELEEEAQEEANLTQRAPSTDGADDILGSLLADDISGLDGSDLLVGRDGDDTLTGDAGNDLLFGEEGDDLLEGGSENDQIFGGEGQDTLDGGDGNDILYGADIIKEDDYIEGLLKNAGIFINTDYSMDNAQADILVGGAGDDSLFIGGNDEVTAGTGNDSIHAGLWMESGEVAVINDFKAGEDVVVYTYDEAAPEPSVSFDENEDKDALIQIDGETILVLRNVAYAQLSPADVHFEKV